MTTPKLSNSKLWYHPSSRELRIGENTIAVVYDWPYADETAESICKTVNGYADVLQIIYKISSLLQSTRDELKANNLCDMIETLVCHAIAKAEGRD